AGLQVPRGQGRQGADRSGVRGGQGPGPVAVPAVKVLAGAVEAACLGLTVVLVARVAVGVFSRYVLQNTFRWYDEIARLCFVWMIFLGAVVAVERRAHFPLHLLVDRLGPRLRRGADVAVSLCVIAFALILIAGGWAIYPVA